MLTLADLIRRARSRLDDELPEYLWSDGELTDYINDTVRDAAVRASLSIQDDVPITLIPGTNKYSLPSSVMEVNAVYLTSEPSNTLRRTSFRALRSYRPVVTQTGTPYSYALDQTTAGLGDYAGTFIRTITFIHTPSIADTAMLDIIRLPALLEDGDAVPEIDEFWHPDLILGVTGLAYLKKDADTFDPKRSARDLQLFEDRFGVRIPASVMRERQTDVPLEIRMY
jgi:hypothetical protein